MNYLQLSYKQLKALPRDELRRALVARADARRNSLRGRIVHGIAWALLGLVVITDVWSVVHWLAS